MKTSNKCQFLCLMIQISCFAGVLVGCGGEQGGFSSVNPSARISSFSGNVTFKKKDLSEWEKAEINQNLYPEERVQTDKESIAKLIYIDASKVTLAPETVLVIESIEPVEEKENLFNIVVKIVVGLTLFEVSDQDGERKLMVASPSAITCVRGTIFSIEVAEDGSTRIVVKKGMVEVIGQGKTVEVKPSYATIVRVGEVPTNPRMVDLINESIFTIDRKKLPEYERKEEIE